MPAVCDPIPSQATSVCSLTSKPLVTVLCAMSVVNFGHVRPREEPGRICWTVTLGEMVEHIDCMIILTPLWCWTFPKDGVFGVVYWHSNVTLICIPAPGLSVHSSEHLSSNTDRRVIPILSEESIHNDSHLVVMNFTALAFGRYLRINITSVFYTPDRD